ncbi:MAG: hypothetical protein AYK19_13735 [Theionarchaea archaeon DG-70-1]|nr:MAG: hypothetical protein AYK19_13735 [Theionarchaea archaeon DG-70-1]
MKKLTKIESLELCRDLFDWLSEHPGKRKFEWPEWRKLEKIYGDFPLHHPCCKYVKETRGRIDFVQCKFCPLYNYFSGFYSSGRDDETRPCEYSQSPYSYYLEWLHRSQNAKRIADAARRKIKELMESRAFGPYMFD